jgi:hypothetical protein
MKATDPSEEKFLRKFRKLPDGRKAEVMDFIDFLSRKKAASELQGHLYGENLEALRMKIRERGGLVVGKKKDQVIKKLRATREAIWKEDYADHFGQ